MSVITAPPKKKTKTPPEVKPALKKPNMYKVLFLNDDITPMDFVVKLLMAVFNKPIDEARAIMLDVHNKGSGIAGIYTADIAETKTSLANRSATYAGYPLEIVMEPE